MLVFLTVGTQNLEVYGGMHDKNVVPDFINSGSFVNNPKNSLLMNLGKAGDLRGRK
jgi:hypothetical protein